MTVYKSKIGLGLVAFISLVLGFGSFLMIRDGIWLGLMINVLVGIFCAYIFLQTYYAIDGQMLKIKCGFFINRSLDILSISEITETNNPIGAPAASLDRLKISFDDHKSVYISPKLKKEFIESLKKLNPTIIVNLKK
jgi:hypothetical protein